MKEPKQAGLERQLLWNLTTDAKEQEVKYFFVIVNDTRESARIKDKLLNLLAPVEELRESASEKNIGGLPYLIMRFNAHNKKIGTTELSSVYRGTIRMDPRFYEREGPDGFDEFVAYAKSKLESLAKPI